MRDREFNLIVDEIKENRKEIKKLTDGLFNMRIKFYTLLIIVGGFGHDAKEFAHKLFFK